MDDGGGDSATEFRGGGVSRLADVRAPEDQVGDDGEYGSASLWKNGYEESQVAKFAVHDGTQAKLVPCQPFFDEIGHEE